MKSFSTRFEDLPAHSIDNQASNRIRNLTGNSSPDRHLVAEFKDHIRRTECYLARLEELLHSASPAGKAA